MLGCQYCCCCCCGCLLLLLNKPTKNIYMRSWFSKMNKIDNMPANQPALLASVTNNFCIKFSLLVLCKCFIYFLFFFFGFACFLLLVLVFYFYLFIFLCTDNNKSIFRGVLLLILWPIFSRYFSILWYLMVQKAICWYFINNRFYICLLLCRLYMRTEQKDIAVWEKKIIYFEFNQEN